MATKGAVVHRLLTSQLPNEIMIMNTMAAGDWSTDHTIPAGDCRSAAAALHITRRLTPTACSYDIYNIVTDGKNLLHYAVMTSY